MENCGYPTRLALYSSDPFLPDWDVQEAAFWTNFTGPHIVVVRARDGKVVEMGRLKPVGDFIMKKTNFASMLAVAGGLAIATAACAPEAAEVAEEAAEVACEAACEAADAADDAAEAACEAAGEAAEAVEEAACAAACCAAAE